MKITIAGGRTYSLTESDFAYLDKLKAELSIDAVVLARISPKLTAGTGVDARKWAASNDIAVTEIRARPQKYMARNIVRATDCVVAFPGGASTIRVVRQAEEKGKPVMLAQPMDVWPSYFGFTFPSQAPKRPTLTLKTA